MPRISVIVPVYNEERYITKCIKSIQDQNFKDIEIIIVDDGSIDSSLYLCNEMAKNDKRIKVIHQENGGVAKARNVGLKNAIGEFIGFVDSDDWINPNMYNELMRTLLENNADIVQCDFLRVNSEEEVELSKDPLIINEYNNIEMLYNLYNNNYIPTAVLWNKLYKKNIFDNIMFPKGKIHEDEYVIHKIYYNARKIVTINKELYYYRTTPNSIMNSEFGIKNLAVLDALENRLEFMKSINEVKLYYYTLEFYAKKLVDIYIQLNRDNEEEYLAMKNIRKKARIISKDFLMSSLCSLKRKIKFIIFMVLPNGCKKILY